MDAECRIYPRQPIEMPVVLISTAFLATKVSTGTSLDLSEGGISVLTDQTLDAGQQVSVEFSAPHDDQLVHLRAVVRHRQDDRYGMQFVSTSPEQAKYIRLVVGRA